MADRASSSASSASASAPLGRSSRSSAGTADAAATAAASSQATARAARHTKKATAASPAKASAPRRRSQRHEESEEEAENERSRSSSESPPPPSPRVTRTSAQAHEQPPSPATPNPTNRARLSRELQGLGWLVKPLDGAPIAVDSPTEHRRTRASATPVAPDSGSKGRLRGHKDQPREDEPSEMPTPTPAAASTPRSENHKSAAASSRGRSGRFTRTSSSNVADAKADDSEADNIAPPSPSDRDSKRQRLSPTTVPDSPSSSSEDEDDGDDAAAAGEKKEDEEEGSESDDHDPDSTTPQNPRPGKKRRRTLAFSSTRSKRLAKRPTARAKDDESDDEPNSGCPTGVPRFKCVNRVREGHGQPLYFVVFNSVDERHADVFATAGGNRVTVYRALPSGAVDPLQLYVDEDAREYFYALAWSIDLRTGSPLLALAGQNGVIKIVDLHTRRVVRRLIGHGSSINALKVHPHDLNILMSVSKDMSVRLWNLASGDCVAIFAGDEGHRDEVLSGDFHASGDQIVSSGMDHSVMIWTITDRIKQAMAHSYLPSHERPTDKPFPTVLVQYPAFSTNQVHTNYVDHVQFYGDFVLSKATEEKIVMWKVRSERKKKAPQRLLEYTFTECDIWYIRFAMDQPHMKYLCVGNKSGALFVWNAESLPVAPPRRLTTPHSQRAIRCVAFNQDASVLLAACEDGTLFRWDAVTKTSAADRTTQPSQAAAAAGATPSPASSPHAHSLASSPEPMAM